MSLINRNVLDALQFTAMLSYTVFFFFMEQLKEVTTMLYSVLGHFHEEVAKPVMLKLDLGYLDLVLIILQLVFYINAIVFFIRRSKYLFDKTSMVAISFYTYVHACYVSSVLVNTESGVIAYAQLDQAGPAMTNASAYIPEGAFAATSQFSESHALEASIVAIFAKIDGVCRHLGHGVKTKVGIITADHVILDNVEEYLVAKWSDHSKMLLAKVLLRRGDVDQAILEARHLGPVLQVKDAPMGFIETQGGLVVPHFDAMSKKMTFQHVQLCKDNAVLNALEKNLLVGTKSNTVLGDSGMPIFQANCVVAVHIGSSAKLRVNLHSVLHHEVKDVIDRLVGKRAAINALITKESPVIGTDLLREQLAREAHDRMLGLHREDNAVFVSEDPRKKQPRIWQFTGKSWADIEEETTTDAPVPAQTPAPLNLRGQAEVPAQKPSPLPSLANAKDDRERIVSPASTSSSQELWLLEQVTKLRASGLTKKHLDKLWKNASLEAAPTSTSSTPRPGEEKSSGGH